MSVLYLVNLATIFTSDPMALLAHGTLQFLVPDLWPHSNPGVNPVDYKVGGVIQERVYRTPMLDVADLKRRLIAAWSDLQQNVIDETTNRPVAWTAARLHENCWATLPTFNLII